MKKVYSLLVMLCLSLVVKAQTSAMLYSWGQTTGTYTAISGTSTDAFTGVWDNGASVSAAIGFTFNFAGTNYTNVMISPNGFIHFGTGAVSATTTYTALSTALGITTGVVAASACNLVASSTTDPISYQTTGTAPNRVFVVQYKNVRFSGSAATESWNFQIKLYETSNIIQLHYGTATTPTTTRTMQVGIRSSSLTDMFNVTTTTNWSAATRGTSTTATMTRSTTVQPANGLIYSFCPQAARPTVSVSTASGCSSFSTTASGASTYAWTPATGLSATSGATVTVTGTTGLANAYQVTGFDANGCSNIAVVNSRTFSVAATAVSNTVCPGDTTTLRNTPSSTYYLEKITTSLSSTTGFTTFTPTTGSADDGWGAVTIPFSFNYFGTNYTSVNINTNGYVNFGTGVTTGYGNALPVTTTVSGGVCLFMHDMNIGSGNITYGTVGTAPNRIFVISYNNYGDFSGTGANRGQVKFFETSNIIELHIDSTAGTNQYAKVTGIQNIGGTIAYTAPNRNLVNFQLYPATNEAWRFSPYAYMTYTYAWSPSAGVSSSTSSSTVATVSAPTTYSVTLTTGGCSATGTRAIANYALPTISVSPTNACFGATMTASGASTYSWMPAEGLSATTGASVVPTPTIATTYTVTGRSAVGCTNTATKLVNMPPSISLSASAPVYCGLSPFGGTAGSPVTMNASGGLSYTWAPSTGLTATTGASVDATPASTRTYTVSGSDALGCIGTATNTVTFNYNTSAITPYVAGDDTLCYPGVAPMVQLGTGGTWSSSDMAVVTVDPAGVVYGIAAGTAIITYSNAYCGDATLPIVVSGAGITLTAGPTVADYCSSGLPVNIEVSGADTFLWSPSTGLDRTDAASVNASPSATTVYTVYGTNNSSGCRNSTTVTINNTSPGSITGGITSLCTSGGTTTTTWTSTTGGGTWSSSNTAVADVSSGGVVSAVGAGTATITYTHPSNGCYVTRTITVNAPPSVVVTPSASGICASGATSTLSATGASTYTWAPSTGLSATTGATVVASPTTTTTYTTTSTASGCVSTVTTTIGVGVRPVGVVATASSYSICPAGTSTLTVVSSIPSSATQYSVAATTYTAYSTTGFTAGPSGDDAFTAVTIPFSFNFFGTNYTSVNINTNGYVNFGTGLTTGYPAVAVPNTTNPAGTVGLFLHDMNTGGGSINYGTIGTAPFRKFVISYNSYGDFTGTGTNTGQIVFNETSNTIECHVAQTTSTNAYTKLCGIQNPARTIGVNAPGRNGVVYNIASGSPEAWIFYPYGNTGTYTWSPAATLSTTTGATTVASPSSTTTYTVAAGASGCTTNGTTTINIMTTPTISGATSVCQSATVTIDGSIAGGTWASSDLAVATVSSSTGSLGVVGGVAFGTVSISYTACGNTTTRAFTVIGTPATITGSSYICVLGTTTLANATPNGTWSSSNTSVATINSATGVVTGLTVGITTISYSTGCGTAATRVFSVAGAPAAITGTLNVCPSGTSTLANTAYGGTWSSSDAGIATINPSTGIVTATSTPGTTTITFANGCGTATTAVFTVASTPAPITGTPSVCMPGTTVLISQNFNSGMTGAIGGTWTVVNSGDVSVWNWAINTSGAFGGITGDGTQFMGSNPDGAGSTSYLKTRLFSPVFSTVGYPSVTLTLNTYMLSNVTWDTTSKLEYTTDGGTTWNELFDYYNATTGSTTWSAATPNQTFSLPADALNKPSVQLRWNYISRWGFYWGVDNVVVTGNGNTRTLADATSGGTWSSSDLAVATISSAGVVSPVSAGVTTISYTACSIPVTQTFTVNPLPGAITGTTSVCVGGSSTLSNSVSGGTWSSSNPSVASVNSSTGFVSGLSAGIATITYTAACGYPATTVYSVNAAPAAITPLSAVAACVGLTTTLSNASTGGTWSSSATGVATVGSSTGVVYGVAAGTTYITYSNGCGTPTTKLVTINNPGASITGSTTVCQTGTETLANTVAGGAWTSADVAIATIDAGTGVVGGVAAGTVTISYTTEGCNPVTRVQTVNPSPAAITGFTSLCPSGTTTLANAIAGGTWSSSDLAIATITPSTGIVTAYTTPGTTTISYTNACGTATTPLVVGSTPGPISGPTSVCAPAAGATVILSQDWETPAGSAVPNSTTPVSGWSALAASTFLQTASTGATNPAASAQSGSYFLRWNSFSAGSGTTATIVSPVVDLSTAAGTQLTFWVYRDVSAYNTTAYNLEGFTFYINTTPSLTGATTLGFVPRAGINSTTGAYISGTATTTTSGWVQYTCTIPGTFTGTTNYILIGAYSQFGNNCYLDNIRLTSSYSTITLTNTTPGGTWASSTPSVATVNSSTGVVYGNAAGTTTISYTACGTTVTYPVTVTPVPAAISGSTTVCPGATVTLTESVTGGTWSSSNASLATVATGTSTTGIVTGVAAGAVTISYANGCGNPATYAMTVKQIPDVITGSTSLCPSSTTTLANLVSGGTWTSSNTSVAAVGSSTGIVTSTATPGTTTITYSNGCAPDATAVFTVSATPGPITGSTSVCMPYSTTLLQQSFNSGLTGEIGGTWSITSTVGSAPRVFAIVNSPGSSGYTGDGTPRLEAYYNVVTSPVNTVLTSPTFSTVGVTTGTLSFNQYLLYYTPSTSTVDYSIDGGLTWNNIVSYTASSGTGTWTSATPTVSYSIPAGMLDQENVRLRWNYVGATSIFWWLIDNIRLTANVSGSRLYNTTPGGTWASSDMAVATITSTGVVRPVTTGPTTISYTACSSTVTTVVNINPTPAAITGTLTMCQGASTTLANSVSGGTWTSSSTSIATVNASTGEVFGVAGGTSTISYSNGCGLGVTAVVTVTPTPAAISGATGLCPSNTTTLTNTVSGGTWTSSDPSIAAIGSSTGILTASSTPGTTTITYANGCSPAATTVVTVSGTPAPITGPTSVCPPATVNIFAQDWETPAGSAVPTSTTPINGWSLLASSALVSTATSSSNPTATPQTGSYFMKFASFGSTSGANATIVSPSFSLSGRGGTTMTAWVYRDVSAFNSSTYATEGFTFYINTTPSVTGATTLGFVPRPGAVARSGSYISGTNFTGVTGWYQYTFTMPPTFTGSTNYILIRANSNAGNNLYLDNISMNYTGSYITLNNATAGGTWESSATSVATVTSPSSGVGNVYGVSAGTTTISYTACAVTQTYTVNVNSGVGAITGLGTVCVGNTLSLSNSAGGGTWSTSTGSIITIDATTGVVTGLATGTGSVTYTTSCGTSTTGSVTVLSAPAAITGASSMCPSSSTYLANAVGGGTWSSSDTTLATVDALSGNVITGATVGTFTISYSTGCAPVATQAITINSTTDTISGRSVMCQSFAPYYVQSWESGVPTTAATPVDGWLYVQGVGATNNYWNQVAGTATTNPATSGVPSGGGTNVAVFRSNTITAGNTAALVSPSFSLADGTGGAVSLYFYRDGTSGVASRYDSLSVFVNTTPAIGGTWVGSICRSRTLSTAFSGTAVASGWYKYTMNFPSSLTGSTYYVVLRGYSAGSGNNMYVDSILIRNNAGEQQMTDATPGGTWSTSDAAVATVNSITGYVTALSAGTATITYTGTCGDPATKTVTVNPGPTAITGLSQMCIGASTSYTIGSTGGSWSVSNTSVATIDPSTGSLTALSAGTATVSYYTGCGWPAIRVFTVYALPTVGTLTAADNLCIGNELTLSNSGASGPSGATVTSYNWSGPDGYVSTTSTPSASFSPTTTAATGIYSVTVTYSYLGCTSNVDTESVTVGSVPVAYNVTGGNGCTSIGITVGVSNTESVMSYQLYRNGSIVGSPVSGTGSSITFPSVSTAGYYTVIASGPGLCQSTMIGADTILVTPSFAMGAAPSLCRPATSTSVTYSDVVGSPTTYDLTWNSAALAAGFTNASDVTLTPSFSLSLVDTAGTYSGTIVLKDNYCSSTAQPFSVNIYNYPVASVTSVTVPCLGYAGNLVFTGTAGANISYTVDGGAPASAVLTGGTYTLSTGAIAEPHTYALINANNIACTNIEADTIITITPNAMQWLGTVSSDWNDGSNWKCGFQPTASDDAIIPSGTTYSPELVAAGTGTTRNITIQSGAAVALNSSSILSVKGSVSNDGQITGSGKVALNGTSSQTITGIGSLNNLELDNTSGASVTGASRMTIRRTLTITSGTLNTNDSVVLASDASATARVAPIVSGGINGQVQLQKYIPGGRRAFRFLSHPFAEAMSLMQWQDGDIDITGTGGATNGFTFTGSNAASAFRYNPTVGNSASSYDPGWRPITNLLSSTSDSNWMQRYQGMRLFVRGSKGEGLSYASYTPSATTLTMKGNLNQGNQVVYMSKGSTSGQDYNLLGNPYASPVDIGTIAYNAKVSGNMVGAAVYVWNPYMATSGIFQAVPVNTVSATPYYLEANGAFEIRAAHNGDSLVFTESSKSANVTTSLVKAIPEYVSLMVYDANNKPWDMMYVRFDEGSKDEEESENDAIKLKNPDFSIYSMSTDGKALAIDARPYSSEKVIPMGIESKVAQDYVIKAEGVSIPAGASLYLHDKQLNKYVELTQGASYSFTISSSTGSGVDTRFELSMRQGSAVAGSVKGLSVSMTPNPASEDVKISFVNGKKESVKVRLLDMNGVSIYNEDMGVRSSGVVTIPLSNYAAGIYMVELTSGSQVVTKRLVKE